MTTLQLVVGSISGVLLIYILYGIFRELSAEEGGETGQSVPPPAGDQTARPDPAILPSPGASPGRKPRPRRRKKSGRR